MRNMLLATALATLAVGGTAMADGPVTITGHVATNTLVSGRLVGVPVGAPVRMVFETRRDGFDPFWGPTGHFCTVDEVSFELHAGDTGDERINYSGANNSSMLFVNSGFVTSAVNQCVFEFFQMTLDSPGYTVYFKAQDLNGSVGWDTPLVCGLPASTPSSAFDTASGSWYVRQTTQVPVTPAPEMTITFDGAITVGHTGCAADFDKNGTLAVADIFAFLNSWFAGCHGQAGDCAGTFADYDCSNTIAVQDIFAFLNAWFAGC